MARKAIEVSSDRVRGKARAEPKTKIILLLARAEVFIMSDEPFSVRRGIGGEEKYDSPGGEGMEQYGPILMEGPAKRQGEGWKGMKPWNDRSLTPSACNSVCNARPYHIPAACRT